jgi:hypothetical protein
VVKSAKRLRGGRFKPGHDGERAASGDVQA